MIPIELLRQVKTLVSHGDCPDGMSAMLLLHDALPDAEIHFVNYGKREYLDFPATPNQLWCDIIPPAERADEFVKAGAIVLDHHKGAEDVVKKFGDRGVFADEKLEPGVSGAVLAFREVWCAFLEDLYTHNRFRAQRIRPQVEDFATLAGIRDTWQKSHPRWREALVAYHALTLHDWEHWKAQGRPWLTAEELKVGEALLKKRERDVEKCAGDAWIGPISVTERVKGDTLREFETTFQVSVAILNCPYDLASDTSDYLREQKGVDLILAFRYEARGKDQVVRVSARSNERYDCAVLAKSLGGGGHTRAAGFELQSGNLGEPFNGLWRIVHYTPQQAKL